MRLYGNGHDFLLEKEIDQGNAKLVLGNLNRLKKGEF
jgi:hypothetical protein